MLLTTVNAILQRVPAREAVARQSLAAAPGNLLSMNGIVQWLDLNGFNRASTVREPGDYAVRGGILDLFAPGMDEPVRFDFFGDTLESIRSFDAETQRTNADLRSLDLVPMSEFQLTSDTIRRFAPAMWRRSAPPAPTTCFTTPSAKAAAMPAWSIGCRCSTNRWKRCSIISPARPSRSSRRPRTPPTSGSRRSPTITRHGARRSIRTAPVRPISRCRPTGFI